MLRNEVSRRFRSFTFALVAALMIAGCAANNQNATSGALQPGSVQDFVVNVGDRVFFTVNQTTLSPTARATLDKQAQWLALYPQYQLTIEGHADERGTREYNIGLGARRAASVRDYLVSRGVDGNRLNTISFGKERPVAVCNDESCWSQNRRAVSVINNVAS